MGEESPAAGGGAAAAAAGKPSGTALPRRGKSCKGCLYYSSMLRSRGFNPVCVGIPRSIPQGKTKRTLISPPPKKKNRSARSIGVRVFNPSAKIVSIDFWWFGFRLIGESHETVVVWFGAPVPSYVVDEPREEAAAQGHDLRQFKYACAGYSMFVVDNKDGRSGEKEGKTLLPYCQGLEVGFHLVVINYSMESQFFSSMLI